MQTPQHDTGTSGVYEKILRYATQQFRRKGVKGVRMDDMAVGLGMSKRTLYELFGNKETLLLESIRYVGRQHQTQYAQFAQQAQTPVEVYVYAVTVQLRDIDSINPAFMSEASRYAPVRQFLDAQRTERDEKGTAFLRKCINEGYLRADINIPLLLQLQEILFRAIMDAELYKQFPFSEIVHFVSYVNFRGQCTEKGLRELDRCIAAIEQTDNKQLHP